MGLGNLYLFQLISTVWVEISGRWLLESLPFQLMPAVWVEISDKRHQESLPFSADFCLLGRDIRQAGSGFSTLFPGFSLFG